MREGTAQWGGGMFAGCGIVGYNKVSMPKTHPFVTYLEDLRDDRAALATLRRGLGPSPDTRADVRRYVTPWLPDDTPYWREAAYTLVAVLYACHPDAGGMGNMGDHMAHACDPGRNNTAIEHLFLSLLAADQEGLDFHLRQVVGFLKSKEVPVNWHQLLLDLLAWDQPNHPVQKRWACAFWGDVPWESPG